MTKYLASSAKFSRDGAYRYWLTRRLSYGERMVMFVGLNPSTADADKDDPTIRRCVGYARDWGFDWLLMGNICAYRSTNPKKLSAIDDAVGPENQEALKWMSQKAEVVVAAWGSHPLPCKYAKELAGMVLSWGHTRCLGVNKGGAPKHPLYLKKTAALERVAPKEDSL